MPYEFVRSLPSGESEWRDVEPGAPTGTITLTPGHVMALGLGDKLREGIENAATAEDIRPGTDPSACSRCGNPRAEGAHGPGFCIDRRPQVERQPERIKVLGGHTDEWRWQVVEDGDGLLWAIDNRPALDAWKQGDQLEPAPAFHHLVIPDDVLRAVVR